MKKKIMDPQLLVFCSSPTRKHYLDLPLYIQKTIYQIALLDHDQHKLKRYIKYWFERPVSRFVKHYKKNELLDIIKDLRNQTKEEHWIWYIFPIEKNSWGDIQVSKRTIFYSIQDHSDIYRLLSIPVVYKFYHYFLKCLEEKSDLYEYFDSTDLIKFICHLVLFKQYSNEFPELSILWNKLFKKAKRDLKLHEIEMPSCVST